MGIIDFFKKPKWKNSNSKIRLAAVEEMSADDLETLVKIIRDDSEQQVRLAALMKVDDRKYIELLLQEDLPEAITVPVREKLEEIYTDLIISGSEECIPDEILARMTNQNLLARIAVEADAVDLRCQAVAKIDEPQVLCELLKNHCGKKPALAAVQKIDDPRMLAEIAEKAVNKSARTMAAGKLSREEPEDNSKKESISVRKSAKEKQTVPDQNNKEKNHSKIIAEKIQTRKELCSQLENLCKEMGDESEIRFAEIEKNWPADDHEIDDEELLTLQKHYEETCNRFRTTLNELSSEKHSMENLTASCLQIEKLLQDDNIDRAEVLLTKNIQKLESMGWQWLDTDNIAARFSAGRKKVEQRKEELAEITRIESKKLQAIEDICTKMEELVASPDRHQAEKKAKKLIQSWKRLSNKAGNEYSEISARFQSALDDFWKKQKQFYKEQEWQWWNNKNKKEELCAIVESLKEENDLYQVSRKLKECEAAWKETGQVSKRDSNELWHRFKTACDENFARCRVFFAELDQKRRDSIVKKEKLCTQAEEHVTSTNWNESAAALKRLQQEWKEAGPGLLNQDKLLYKKFRKACDQFFDRRSAFFAEKDIERKDNLRAKEQLCLEVEDLVREPKLEHDKLIRELQKRWKEIGPAPRENEQEIWHRFRGTCDSYYAWIDEQRLDNLQLKIALCEQLESLLPENAGDIDREEALLKVLECQKQWKSIGPVPRKESDAIWKKFRGQCDNFFSARKIQLQEDENQTLENQRHKEHLLQMAGEVIQQLDEQKITAQLLGLQKEWQQFGPALNQQEQLLSEEFKALCSAFLLERKEPYKETKSALNDTLKKKEELCFQLERLTGNEYDLGDADKGQALDLIEQFKIAREANFLLAGKTENLPKKKEEIRRIQQEWKDLGPTYREHEQRLWKRYRRAINMFSVD